MKVSELLIKAKAVISDPDNWAQGYYALDNSGDMCEAYEPQATCFCSVGALIKAGGDGVLDTSAFSNAESLLSEFSDGRYIVNYNDSLNTTHEDVMSVWDKAIEKASIQECE